MIRCNMAYKLREPEGKIGFEIRFGVFQERIRVFLVLLKE